jgi:hypothetical protein
VSGNGNHDLSALLLVTLAFGGFIVAAGTTTNQTELNFKKENQNMTVERNAIWCFESDLSPAMLADCVAHKIFDIYVCVGYPNTADYSSLTGVVTANQWGLQMTQTGVSNALALLASVDSRFKLWGWMGTYSWTTAHGVDAYVDFTTPSKRIVLVAAMVDIAEWGFYGLQDDTEDFANKNTDEVNQALVEYWNLLGLALHSINVKLATFTPAVWHNFNTIYLSGLTTPDYSILVPRYDSEAIWGHDVTEALANSTCPVMLSFGQGFLIDALGWFDTLAPSGISGFALYSWSDAGGISGAEWTTWDAWVPKTLTDPLVVVNPVVATPTLTSSSIEVSLSVVASTTVNGTSGDGTGTVTFYASSNNGTSWIQMGATKTLAVGAAASDAYYPPGPGNYIIIALYSGDVNYNAMNSNSSSLTVTTLTATSLGLLGAIITKMEAANVGDSYWDRGIWEDGMWEHDTPMINAVKQLESYSGIQTVSANVCEPGMDIITSPFKTTIQKLESY